MKQIMIDLETMGVSTNAALLSIGAVKFSVEHGIEDRFHTIIDLCSSVTRGLEIDPNTVLWWMQQNDDARAQFKSKGLELRLALSRFNEWLGTEKRAIWGNGANFDNVILGNAFDKCGLARPWEFWNDRCYRTMKAMHKATPFKRIGTHHNALQDAESQAVHLIEIFKTIGITDDQI
jgi:exodeoxyribonuclease VIII